jgi:hypothetical protein
MDLVGLRWLTITGTGGRIFTYTRDEAEKDTAKGMADKNNNGPDFFS